MDVNSTQRYPFTPLNSGAFFFVTDHSCYYTIEITNEHNKFFDNELLHNGGQSFEISINRTCDEEPPFDEFVGHTIIHILNTNIASKGDTAIFFYVCDVDGGKGRLRARKFSIWYNKIKEELIGLQKYNFVLKGYDGELYDISLLIFENHPHREEYIENFEKKLMENFSKS